jgi:integrase
MSRIKDEVADLNRRFRLAKLHGVTAEATRHGRLVVYFRRTLGHPKVRLRSQPLTPTFMVEWSALAQGQSLPVTAASPMKTAPLAVVVAAKAGTLRAVIEGYYKSNDFLAKQRQTRHVEKRVLDDCCLEPIAPGSPHTFGELPFNDLRPRHILVLQERKVRLETSEVVDEDTGEEREVEVRRGVEAGNRRVKCLRSIYKYAKRNDLAEINFAAEVSYLKSSNPTGHETWTEEDVAAFEAHYPLGSKQRLALTLLLYASSRRGDVVRLGPRMIKVEDGCEILSYMQEKKRNSNPVRAFVPVVPPLRAALDATPPVGLTFLSWGKYGQPYKKNSFGNLFHDWCADAGLRKGLSLHGLRKACVVRMIKDDNPSFNVMAITGHRTLKEIERYGREFNRNAAAKRVFENWLKKHGPTWAADEVRLASLAG